MYVVNPYLFGRKSYRVKDKGRYFGLKMVKMSKFALISNEPLKIDANTLRYLWFEKGNI